MEIGPVNNSQPRPTGTENEKRGKNKTPAIEPPTDRVEISHEARVKLAVLADRVRSETLEKHNQLRAQVTDPGRQPELNRDDSQTKLQKARSRIESDYYNRLEVMQEIARRLANEFIDSPNGDDEE